MAESPVTFLLDRLTMILEEKRRDLKGVKESVENINDELERMMAFLRVADSMEESHMEIKIWVKQVRDLAYDIEDFLDRFTLHSSIEQLHNLRSLYISSTEEDEILDLQYLSSPPVLIQRVNMCGRLAKFPHWISSLDNLVKIYFRWSRLRDDPLKYLQDLPNLVHLEFLVAYVGDELRFKAGEFQKLKLLDLDKLEPLREVIVEEGAMPKLEKIIIQRCTFLESVPTGIELLANMQALEFFDMPDEFIAKLLPGKADGDHHKVAHIPQVYYTYWRDGGWEAYPLEAERKDVDSTKPRTVIRTNDQRNSL